MQVFLQKAYKILLTIVLLAIPFQTSAGTNDVFKGWSWTPNIGWISMNSTNCSASVPGCGGTAANSYGVTLDDSRNLTGWAWSSNLGWICFGSTCLGTAPDGGSSWALMDNDPSTPQVYGWARIYSEYLLNPGGSNGWISLNCKKNPAGHASGPNDCLTGGTGVSDYKVFSGKQHLCAFGSRCGHRHVPSRRDSLASNIGGGRCHCRRRHELHRCELGHRHL